MDEYNFKVSDTGYDVHNRLENDLGVFHQNLCSVLDLVGLKQKSIILLSRKKYNNTTTTTSLSLTIVQGFTTKDLFATASLSGRCQH
ncbi:hypothetical protein FF38_04577 [Lucilia cuprina]|uniref:Uncharacterized protein n=1 Tax=Lucilia cuprina TaxID=7375 RepID=A0A0L0BWF1_LUCCU|nr:hypothetical protein FF38_04577 [Lucilia cuprina]